MFSTPVALLLESQPIGRGTVQLLNGEKGRGQGSAPGEYFMSDPSARPLHNRYMADISVACQAARAYAAGDAGRMRARK